MTSQEIEQRIIAILANKLQVDGAGITADTRLAEDLGVDSFGAVELMFEIEEAFGLKIPDSEIEQVRKVRDISDYIVKYTAERPPNS